MQHSPAICLLVGDILYFHNRFNKHITGECCIETGLKNNNNKILRGRYEQIFHAYIKARNQRKEPRIGICEKIFCLIINTYSRLKTAYLFLLAFFITLKVPSNVPPGYFSFSGSPGRCENEERMENLGYKNTARFQFSV